jgi:streptogramin lyase
LVPTSYFGAAPYFYKQLLFLFVLVLLGAGCSRGREGAQPSFGGQQRLFVTEAESATLLVYQNPGGGEQPAIATIRENPPDRPVDCAVNFVGEVYVANANGNVRVFGAVRGQEYQLIRSYEGPHTRLEHPVAIAVNPVGSFYIADTSSSHGRVEWFSGGAHEDILPDKVLEGPHTGINAPGGVAIDGSGRTYVTDRTSNRILIFDPNAHDDATPLAALDGLHSPGRIAVDDLVNIYVVDGDGTIAVFNSSGPESWTPGPPITSKLEKPAAVAIDSSGRIAIGAVGGVWFFASDAQRDADPLFSLHGRSTQLNPSGLCFHKTAAS